MARYFLPEATPDLTDRIKSGQHDEVPNRLMIPPLFGGGHMPLKKGGIAFGLVGHQFWHVGPGEYVDLPDTVPATVIKASAPQLLNKAEAVERGIAADDGTLIKKKPVEDDAGKRKKE